MGNDAGDLWTAGANCSFCAVGGLFNKSASDVMKRVCGLLGEALPGGMEGERCGELRVRLYEKLTGQKVKVEGQGYLVRQLKGICEFIQACGCKVHQIGSIEKPMRAAQIVEEGKKLPAGTAFLLLTADDDGLGMAALAHWVCGQIQGGKPKFFDYQLKVFDQSLGSALNKKAKSKVQFSPDAPYASDTPLSPWGQELDEDDGRGVMITVTK